jgi:hypothetical protein
MRYVRFVKITCSLWQQDYEKLKGLNLRDYVALFTAIYKTKRFQAVVVLNIVPSVTIENNVEINGGNYVAGKKKAAKALAILSKMEHGVGCSPFHVYFTSKEGLLLLK